MPSPRLAALFAVSAVAASCGPTRPANSEKPVVQDVKTEEVPLRLELGSPPPPPIPPPQPASAGPGKGEGYGYEFDDDPLAVGGTCPINTQCRERPVPTRQNPACPEWSRCEITGVLELNKDLFNPCWRKAFGAGGSAAASITFHARATIGQDGHVHEIAIERVAPDTRKVAACLTRAFRQIPFPLETFDTTTRLEVPVRLSAP